MTRTAVALAALIVAFSGLTGCTGHYAYVRGVAGEQPAASVPDDAMICVAADPNGKEWDFNDEISKDLEALLRAKGFRIANSSSADYFLFYEFDRETMMTRARLEPFSSGVQSGQQTVKKEGPFDLTISLRLVEAGSYHERGMAEFAWAGAAKLAEAPTESMGFVHLLMVAAIDAFPDDTGKTLKHKFDYYDSRVKELRRN